MLSAKKLLPVCLTFPSKAVLEKISYSGWNECLQMWIAVLRAYLYTPLHELEQASSQYASLVNLLVSYARETSGTPPSLRRRETDEFRRLIFLNTHRLVLKSKLPPPALLNWTFLADFWGSFDGNEASCSLVALTYSMHNQEVDTSLRKIRDLMISSLESSSFEVFQSLDFNRRLLPLIRSTSAIAAYFVTGSDFIDTSISSYAHAIPSVKIRLLVLFYFGLSALAEGAKPQKSQLVDVLYTLKSPVAASTAAPEEGRYLISDLVSKTPFFSIIRKRLSGHQSGRVVAILKTLEPLQLLPPVGPKPKHAELTHSRVSNTKDQHALTDANHLSLISRVQDLFPDLGSAFVLALLEYFDNDIEAITSSLLDSSLPPHFLSLDSTEKLPESSSFSVFDKHATRSVQQTLEDEQDREQKHSQKGKRLDSTFSERRNQYDHDALDTLNISKGQLYHGKRPQRDITMSTTSGKEDLKAAIMSALSTFDADDDEHDDTYDAEDVGGTVDLSLDFPNSEHLDDVEEALYKAWAADGGKDLFARSSAARRSVERQNLKKESNMTDEAIEGWALMLAREPQRLRRLERRFIDKLQSQPQAKLESTKWRAEKQNEDNEATDHAGTAKLGLRGQGFGADKPVANANVTAHAADTSTQLARQRKDADKAKRANHNRRNQRARKVARAGLPS